MVGHKPRHRVTVGSRGAFALEVLSTVERESARTEE